MRRVLVRRGSLKGRRDWLVERNASCLCTKMDAYVTDKARMGYFIKAIQIGYMRLDSSTKLYIGSTMLLSSLCLRLSLLGLAL